MTSWLWEPGAKGTESPVDGDLPLPHIQVSSGRPRSGLRALQAQRRLRLRSPVGRARGPWLAARATWGRRSFLCRVPRPLAAGRKLLGPQGPRHLGNGADATVLVWTFLDRLDLNRGCASRAWIPGQVWLRPTARDGSAMPPRLVSCLQQTPPGSALAAPPRPSPPLPHTARALRGQSLRLTPADTVPEPRMAHGAWQAPTDRWAARRPGDAAWNTALWSDCVPLEPCPPPRWCYLEAGLWKAFPVR